MREVSSLLLMEIKDPRVAMVTITGTRVSDDLRIATVFYSIIGDNARWEEAGKGLNSTRGYIKRELGRRLKMKYVPDIRFREDRSLERGERMDRMLSGLKVDDE